ncbi:MAG: RIP metalloprotease RseP [Treponema sp.]|nr:RIP metalloprotease RseP [Treponema sp.]
MTIIYGLIALSLIIFIHEMGHFIAARFCGVKVEAFSIGMGPALLHKEYKGTDWRISLIPFGGYCAMKGQEDLQITKEGKDNRENADSDSFYGVATWKRIIIAFCGPLFNVIFAVLSFTIISMIGFTNYTSNNKIILADEIYPEYSSNARLAGIKTGDKIIKINNKEIKYFSDITNEVSVRPDEELIITVERNGEILEYSVKTTMDKNTGAGKIGVINWIDPIIKDVEKNSIAEKSGLQSGDIIIKIDDEDILNTASINKYINEKNKIELSYLRNEQIYKTVINIDNAEKSNLGLYFNLIKVKTEGENFFKAIKSGLKETFNTIGLTFKSLGLLFKGVDLTKAITGPLRITVMLGDTAKASFSENFTTGIVTMLGFLSLISISLFIMNLLPIPVLDGGIIIFAIIEIFIKKPIPAKVQYYVQFIGIAFIIIIFGFALFGDVSYIIKQWR